MSKTNTGGPAFPVPNDANVNGQEGMTLRDYFAAKAMEAHMLRVNDWSSRRSLTVRTAEEAYIYADAMIAERDKEKA